MGQEKDQEEEHQKEKNGIMKMVNGLTYNL
jgi:hypothetical protein